MTMNISQEEAQASLSKVRDVTVQTQRAVTSAYASPLLILWGTLWIIAFTATHFYIEHGHHIFTAMSIVGSAVTVIIFYRLFHSRPPFRDDPSGRLGWRIAALWILLYVYVMIWLFLLAPYNGMQRNAFISTAVMFACVVIGLWFDNRFIVILGRTLTAATLVGFYILRDFYCLWMAFVGGGTMLGAGLYIRMRWR